MRAAGGAVATEWPSRLPAGEGLGLVLADNDVVEGEGPDRAQNFDLFVPDVLGVQAQGLLHGEEGEHLEEMVLHYVADDPVVVKVPGKGRVCPCKKEMTRVSASKFAQH